MAATLRYLHLLALVIWIGGVVFFSFFTAPALFSALPREMAGRATAAIFPRYYMMGGICGGVALLTCAFLAMRRGGLQRLALAEMLLLIAMIGLTLYAGGVILPEAASLRPILNSHPPSEDLEAARSRFTVLHGRSVAMNGLVLLLGAGVILTMTLREDGGGG